MPTIAEYIAQAQNGIGNWWNGQPNTQQASYSANSFPMSQGPMSQPFQFGVPAAPAQAVQVPSYMAAAPGVNSWMDAYGANPTYSNQEMPTITGDPGTGGLKGWLSNGQNLGVAIQGFGTLANAYLGFQQLKNAKANLAFQKDAFNTNLINSTQNYNTSLEDRIRGRTSAYDGKEADVQAYLAKHSLKPPAKK